MTPFLYSCILFFKKTTFTYFNLFDFKKIPSKVDSFLSFDVSSFLDRVWFGHINKR